MVSAQNGHLPPSNKNNVPKMSPLFLTDFTEKPQVPKMSTCGIQTVKEVFGSFDGFFANGEVFCDFVGSSFEAGTNVPILGTLVFTIVAPNARISYAHLLCLIRLADQDGVSGNTLTSWICTYKSDACQDNAVIFHQISIDNISKKEYTECR